MSYTASEPPQGQATGINDKLRDFNRAFVSQGELPGREFYKLVLVAPGIESLYGATLWPGIMLVRFSYCEGSKMPNLI